MDIADSIIDRGKYSCTKLIHGMVFYDCIVVVFLVVKAHINMPLLPQMRISTVILKLDVYLFSLVTAIDLPAGLRSCVTVLPINSSSQLNVKHKSLTSPS